MNRKFWISTVVVFVTLMALGSFFHGFLLEADYLGLPNLFRSEAECKQYFAFRLGSQLIMSGALVWIYRRGKESKPFLGQGLRFGLGIALVGVVPLHLIHYAIQPLPGLFVAKGISFDTLTMLATGVVLARLER